MALVSVEDQMLKRNNPQLRYDLRRVLVFWDTFWP